MGHRPDTRRPADRRAEPGGDARRAIASARTSTAPRTGTRRRSIRRPVCTTCRPTSGAASSRARPGEWEAGKGFFGGSFRVAVNQPQPTRVLRAIDVQTGRMAWQLTQAGARNSWGGTLSTAGGVVFFGEESGAFMAVDAADGRPLWQFQTSQFWNASPMTYMFDQTAVRGRGVRVVDPRVRPGSTESPDAASRLRACVSCASRRVLRPRHGGAPDGARRRRQPTTARPSSSASARPAMCREPVAPLLPSTRCVS